MISDFFHEFWKAGYTVMVVRYNLEELAEDIPGELSASLRIIIVC